MVQLSNGRTLVAAGGVLGIDEGLCVYEGYDTRLIGRHRIVEGEETKLSDNERRDLANIMIARWTRFARGY